MVDSRATLTCGAQGAPRPYVVWYRGEEEVIGKRFAITDDGSLVINKVVLADEGQYRCEASNKHGQDTAGRNLTVKKKTIITENPISSEVWPGITVVFHCNARGDPDLDLKITWLKMRMSSRRTQS